MKRILLPILLIMVLFVSGCTQEDFYDDYEESAVTTLEENEYVCVALCLEQKNIGADLSNGPCLGNDIGETPAGEIWVCDIAHDPREDVDNSPANQCEDYRSGVAKHFVEVDEECNVIRAV